MLKNLIKNREFLLHLAWIIAILATLGSLFLSEIMDFLPCELCWYQRIMMYPLPIVLGVGIWLKDKNIHFYALPFAVIGGLIAAYHYWLQMFGGVGKEACSEFVACTTKYVEFFGFATIPFGALLSFIAIGGLVYLSGKLSD